MSRMRPQEFSVASLCSGHTETTCFPLPLVAERETSRWSEGYNDLKQKGIENDERL